MLRIARRMTRRTVRRASTAAVRTAVRTPKALFSVQRAPKRPTPVSDTSATYARIACISELTAEMNTLAAYINKNSEMLQADPDAAELVAAYRDRLLARVAALKN